MAGGKRPWSTRAATSSSFGGHAVNVAVLFRAPTHPWPDLPERTRRDRRNRSRQNLAAVRGFSPRLGGRSRSTRLSSRRRKGPASSGGKQKPSSSKKMCSRCSGGTALTFRRSNGPDCPRARAPCPESPLTNQRSRRHADPRTHSRLKFHLNFRRSTMSERTDQIVRQRPSASKTPKSCSS